MKDKVIVLLSAGLDSSVNLMLAHKQDHLLAALNVDYGQRAAGKERQAAKNLCQKLEVPLVEMSLDLFRSFSGNALTNKDVPLATNMDIHDLQQCQETAKNVWVPNRNGVLLNLAAALAEDRGANYVIPGFNKEEAATFPDNSGEYMQALNQALAFSTQNTVKVRSYTLDMTKTEIYRMGQDLGLQDSDYWYCYEDGEQPCGQCESCLRFANAKRGSR
tara:strand:- start:6348 stop:7001 length:654 start_codon:yes stop_codon:yes gene_type:complete